MNWDSDQIRELIENALNEDIGTGDITTNTLVPESRISSAIFIAKQPGVLAGLPLVQRIFLKLDRSSEYVPMLNEGEHFENGTHLCRIHASTRSLLSGERVALNFLQRMCGIATLSASYAGQARPFGIAVLDTRKTTPLLRVLEKYAVQAGGGTNHRMALYDAVMVKDNHLQVEPDFQRIIMKFESQGMNADQVEIEVVNAEMLANAIHSGAKWFLLDNMTPDQIRECIRMKQPGMKFEVSGGINAENFGEYLIPGVDAISIGALTHSVQSIDISMEIMQ